MKNLSTYTGSLIVDGDILSSPYDYDHAHGNISASSIERLDSKAVLNYSRSPFVVDYKKINSLCIINGMGVTLGDSVVGISALHAIKKINSNICISIVRPQYSPDYVNSIYDAAVSASVINDVITMPCSLKALSAHDLLIDVGNQLYWPDFCEIEMHDFFLRNVGIQPNTVPNKYKKNEWLQALRQNNNKSDYVLFNPEASNLLRSIPKKVHYKMLDHIYSSHDLRVVGFSDVMHPNYTNITKLSNTTFDYIDWILNAKFIYTSDSSALHIAASCSIPTKCYFNSIEPHLRSLYYDNCESIYLGCDLSKGLHDSDSALTIDTIGNNYEKYLEELSCANNYSV